MRALLTGASGFVGTNLKNHLQQKGWQVDSIRHDESLEQIEAKVRDFKPDVVFHLATLFIAEHKTSDIAALIESNLGFGTKVVEAMVKHKVGSFVNTGTLWQYYEGHRNVPSSLYSATKSAFERILQFYSSAYPLKVINLMLSDSFGPGDPRPKLLPKLLAIAGTDEKLSLSPGEQILEWTFISDLVQAFEVAALRLVDGTETKSFMSYTATSGEQHSLRETVRICEQTLGKKILVYFGAKPYRTREIMKPEKLDPILPGWSAKVSFIEGIKACAHE
jgi:nucleoside-diphosphate-sugar epimerase